MNGAAPLGATGEIGERAVAGRRRKPWARPADSAWHPAPWVITLTATDAGGAGYVQYRVDGDTWNKGAYPTLVTNGSHDRPPSRGLRPHAQNVRSGLASKSAVVWRLRTLVTRQRCDPQFRG